MAHFPLFPLLRSPNLLDNKEFKGAQLKNGEKNAGSSKEVNWRSFSPLESIVLHLESQVSSSIIWLGESITRQTLGRHTGGIGAVTGLLWAARAFISEPVCVESGLWDFAGSCVCPSISVSLCPLFFYG